MIKKARFWKIPAYFNTETSELEGRNKLFDFLIHSVAVPLDYLIQEIMSFFGIYQEGWMIEVEKETGSNA